MLTGCTLLRILFLLCQRFMLVNVIHFFFNFKLVVVENYVLSE